MSAGMCERPAWLKEYWEFTADDLSPQWVADRLAGINRFGNRSPVPWSVARHSVLVAELLPLEATKTQRLFAMTHDCHEIFTGDLQRPAFKLVEQALSAYQREIDDHVLPLMKVCPSPFDRGYVHEFDIAAGDLEIRMLGCSAVHWPKYAAFDLRRNDASLWVDMWIAIQVFG